MTSVSTEDEPTWVQWPSRWVDGMTQGLWCRLHQEDLRGAVTVDLHSFEEPRAEPGSDKSPLRSESGTSVRGRPVVGRGGCGGHRRLCKALYLATLSAGRYNPTSPVFSQRLHAAGKPGCPLGEVARCAAARKLLHLAWAVVTKRQPFDDHCHLVGLGTHC